MPQNDILKMISRLRESPMSWQEIAENLNRLYRVKLSRASYRDWYVNGVEPQNARIRKIFGLGPPACPHCHHRASPPRESIKPKEMTPSMHWWRNQLDSKERQTLIARAYAQHHPKVG